jgi:N-acetylglucosamine-6-phosphate deacetylase
MKTIIANGIVLSPDEEIHGRQVVIEDGRIRGLDARAPREAGVKAIDAQGWFVIPGLIDIHVHGANGCDTMDATPEAIQGMGRFLARHGVTSFLPTTVAASPEATLAAIENVGRTPFPTDGAHHLGIHVEGPYLNSACAGAQPVQHLRPAAPEEYERWITTEAVRLITVAPEVKGVLALLDAGAEAAIEFSIGHSAASYEQVRLAIEHGLRQVTHVFNGMPPMHHRSPGVVGAALSDEHLGCQIIADGVHVHPAVVRILVKSKGIDGTILITDAIRATGLPDGDYALGDQQIHVQAGVARTGAGSLAGSTLTMDKALRNVIRFADLSLLEALPMATRVPAAAMGWDGKKGVIAPNADADLVIMDNGFQVRLTMVAGRVVFDAL